MDSRNSHVANTINLGEIMGPEHGFQDFPGTEILTLPGFFILYEPCIKHIHAWDFTLKARCTG